MTRLYVTPSGEAATTEVGCFKMQKLPRILIALSLGAAAALSAQTNDTAPETQDRPNRGGPGRHGHGPGMFRIGHPVVRALDADKDRELSAAELSGASAALRALDTNKDGSVAKDELHPLPPAGMRKRSEGAPEHREGARERPAGAPDGAGEITVHRVHPRLSDPVMLALDANADGALSDAEISNATASLNALDANKDGKLTFDELRPLPPAE